MVFESILAAQPDPDETGNFETGAGSDPRAQLQQMLKSGGGINLAYKLMKADLDMHVRILWVAEKACWDWYTHQIKSVKLPSDTLAYSLRLCDGHRAAHVAYNAVHFTHTKISAAHGDFSWHIQGGSQGNVYTMAYQDATGVDNDQTRLTAGVVCWNPWQGNGPSCSTDED